jgi:ssDNA-binding Zn-finger/Zn-ribbon topoisomerase 1
MLQHRCPDCSVTMAEVEFGMDEGWGPGAYVKTGEKREGLLGKLGMNERKELTTVMCPECGMVRHFADFEDEADAGL